MTPAQLEKRRRVMQRSIALGHCVCNPRLACPCEEFRRHGICHCAGERPPETPAATQAPVRLTDHVRNPGCASKIDKNLLKHVLTGLPELNDPRVVVGASCGDDAGVINLDDSPAALSTILTVDVFAPVVDDPYTFGQIAAANSLSDIYAMGGTPQVALSIVGFPVDTLPPHALREILRGGTDKMNEAQVPIIGGHSINDVEPKCGFAVVGTCPKNRYIRNANAQVGDLLVLTKPLGTGIMAFARQIGRLDDLALQPVAQSMASLNRIAGAAMIAHGVHAATDITGFGFLGHLAEIVRHSGPDNQGVTVELDFAALPLFDGVAQLAEAQVLPGACERNRESIDDSPPSHLIPAHDKPRDSIPGPTPSPAIPPQSPRELEPLLDFSSLSPAQIGILTGPETSGGILAFLPPTAAHAFLADLHRQGITAARIIGRVTALHPGGKITVLTSTPSPTPHTTEVPPMSETSPTESCCCAASHPAATSSPAATTAPSPATNGTLPPAAAADALKAYLAAVNAPGALDVKHKKLISLALSIVCKCAPCVTLNAQAARNAGATDPEIAEAAALAIAFGGSSAMMFYNTLRNP
jgi:selenide,water dikinase